jgi:hypothetical protein
MGTPADPAFAHLRMMEIRIEQQVSSIQRLRQSGEETSAAERRLDLLRHAFDEMRIQLGQLALTELDEQRPAIGAIRAKL